MRTIALALSLLAVAPVLNAQGGSGVRVHGRVVDAATQAPVSGAVVVLDRIGARAVSDEAGEFVLAGVPPGTHTWAISRLGYARWEESAEVADGDEFTIALLPRPEVLDGIVAVASQIETRRRNSGVAVRSLERDEIRLSGAPTALELAADRLGVRGVPCPNARTPDRSCAWIRNELISPTVFIDEQPAAGGLADLENYRPEDLFTVESYSGGTMVRAITTTYAEALARGRATLKPLAFHSPGRRMPELPDEEEMRRKRRP